jgi:hypothetical protein
MAGYVTNEEVVNCGQSVQGSIKIKKELYMLIGSFMVLF